MGARSAEALARRAAKRGRTVEEEIQAERKKAKEKDKKKGKTEQPMEEASSTAAVEQDEQITKRSRAVGIDVWKARGLEMVRNAGDLKRDEKAGWVCTAVLGEKNNARCGYINFPHRATCRECNTLRYGVAAIAAKQARLEAERKAVATTRRQEKVTDPLKAWAGTNVTPERIEENKKLRERLAKDPDSLSSEERQRAEALIERDARKRKKKEEIRKEKGARSERHAAMREGFRDERRQQVQVSKDRTQHAS